MNIEIRRLSPDLAEDYAHFFNVTPYNVKTDGSKCYCVTRCNANENCHFCIDYLRSFWPIEETRADIRIKPVFCFVIALQMQRMGIELRSCWNMSAWMRQMMALILSKLMLIKLVMKQTTISEGI